MRRIDGAASAGDAVPVAELLELRDDLYENDQITMRGLMKLNRLISKYDSRMKPGWTREGSTDGEK